MKVLKGILEILNSKIVLYILVGVIGFNIFLNVKSCNKNEKIETYNRQLQGQLSDTEKVLQSAHYDLGVAKSKLITQKELSEIIKKDSEEKDKNFEKFKKKHNLKIKSRDKTIASLKQKVNNGESTVVISDPQTCNIDGCVISYSWVDSLERFKLQDPNIFEKNNETFESNQLFKVYGLIYEQEDSSLQIRKLTLREVYKDESGEYKDIEGAKADIIDSEFQYHNPPAIKTEFDWKSLFRLRAIALGSVEVIPEGGDTRLGLGVEFFNFEGFGINSHTGFDFEDPKHIGQYIGASYSPRPFNLDSNLGFGASIGTPFYKLFSEYSFKIDLIFYLHE